MSGTPSEPEDTNKKGSRNENEAKNILDRVFGRGGVEKVDAFTNHDPFGFVDVIAIKPDRKVLFVQVKTNQFTAEHRRKYRTRLRRLPIDHAEFQVWVRVDYDGWRVYDYDPESKEFVQVLEMDTCDIEETVDEVRDMFDFWDE